MLKMTTHWIISVIATLAIITYNVINPSELLHLVSLFVLSAVWIVSSFKYENNKINHQLIIERVEKLKSFSVELQTLINKELILVQDDVVRTKKIIGDSIGILQSSVQEINDNMQVQREYLDSLICASSDRVAISDELSGKPQCKGVKSDLSIDTIVNKNKNNMDNMIIALQFEDIVNQISDRVAQHINDIRSTVDILSKLCESELSNTFQDDIEKMEHEYQEIREKLIKVSSKNLAAQENMKEGEIDLF